MVKIRMLVSMNFYLVVHVIADKFKLLGVNDRWLLVNISVKHMCR